VPASIRLALLGAPLRSSLSTEGTEAAATSLRTFAASGAALANLELTDRGDIELAPAGSADFAAGGASPKNADRVRESILTIAVRVAETAKAGAVPLLFGGDATVVLGLLTGLLDSQTAPSRVGMLSFDGSARFQTPEEAPGGDLSRMSLALAVGRGPLALTHVARDRFPLVQETDVVLAGAREATPPEAAALVESRVTLLTPQQLQGAGGAAAFMGALGRLAPRTRELVFALDASVLDPVQFPVSVGSPPPGGLTTGRLRTLVGELATWNAEGTIRLVGVAVTGVDARKDPGGVRAHELAGFVLRLFDRPRSDSG
jgi:arginase